MKEFGCNSRKRRNQNQKKKDKYINDNYKSTEITVLPQFKTFYLNTINNNLFSNKIFYYTEENITNVKDQVIPYQISDSFMIKKTLDEMQELAKEVGIEKTGIEGECLSKHYINMKSELDWRCGKCGYEFKKTPDKVKFRREWCPRCSGNPHFLHEQITIADMQQLAYIVGLEKTGVPGKCLSKKYISSSTKLEWYCGKCQNHFFMTPNDIKSKRTWCPKCTGREQTIEGMKRLAYEVGIERTGFPGFCLSRKYKGAKIKLKWRCGACDHEFSMTPNKIKSRRSWCPNCAHKVPPTIDEIQKLAYDVGIEKTGVPGEVLSDNYMGSDKEHKWRCVKCGNIFEKRFDKVKYRRSWCPHCSQGYYEKICRGFMERIFSFLYRRKITFPQITLDQIIKSVAGEELLAQFHPLKIGFDITQMHLDGFSFDILVGFERQGKQHYKRIPEWQKTEESFERQIAIDEFKVKFSRKFLKLFIVVGYEMRDGILHRIEPEEMQDYIVRQIELKTGMKLPPIPIFNYKEFLKEDLDDEIAYRKSLGERQGFNYLTNYQRRVLYEFSERALFASNLLRIPNLQDIKSLDWMIRDLFQKGYLKRVIALNPSTKANKKKQYRYSISKLGRKLLNLSNN